VRLSGALFCAGGGGAAALLLRPFAARFAPSPGRLAARFAASGVVAPVLVVR